MTDSKNVILDTNFFVDMFRFKITLADIEDAVAGGHCNFWIVEESLSELDRMSVKEAKIAMRMIQDKEQAKKVLGKTVGVLRIDKHVQTADDAILAFIEERVSGQQPKGVFIVATNDAGLRKQIKALGTKIIYLRARKHLEII